MTTNSCATATTSSTASWSRACELVPSEGRKLQTEFVSGNYFDMLGVRMLRGRALSEVDARAPGSDPVAVLSDQAWARFYDRDPAVLGRTIDLNGHPFVIVGVIATRVRRASTHRRRTCGCRSRCTRRCSGKDLFSPENADAARDLGVVARLRSDVTAERAQEALNSLMADLIDDAKAVRAVLHLRATPNPWTVDSVRADVAGIRRVRPRAGGGLRERVERDARARERALSRDWRAALAWRQPRPRRPATRHGGAADCAARRTGRACSSPICGLRAAIAALLATIRRRRWRLVRIAPLDPDWRVFLFVFAVSSGATILFALVPALQATRLSLTDALRGQPSRGLQRSTLRNVLVVCQVAVSLILLILDATLIRNSASVAAVDLGFRPQGVTSLRQRINGPSLVADAADALRLDGRVETVVVTSDNPLFGMVPKAPMAPGRHPAFAGVGYRYVSPDYFALLHIPILRGRGFTLDEARAEARVAIVSAATAARFWPGEDPVGKTCARRSRRITSPFRTGRARVLACTSRAICRRRN